MDLSSLTALAADRYASARPATEAQPGTSGGLLGIAQDFAATVANGERTAVAAMTGRADAQALVQALTQAELAVDAAVTVRNRVVEAYQEILRMPV